MSGPVSCPGKKAGQVYPLFDTERNHQFVPSPWHGSAGCVESTPLARERYGSTSENRAARVLIVLVLTLLVIALSAILLPPKGSKVTPGEGREAPVTAPR